MDKKFSKLIVTAYGTYTGAGNKTVNVRVDGIMPDLFLNEKDESGKAREAFDIAFARSIVNRAGNVNRLVITLPGKVSKDVFTAVKTGKPDQSWDLAYSPTGDIQYADGQDHPVNVVHGKPENRYERDEIRAFAVNTLKIGLRAYGIYIPRESTIGEETPVVIPDSMKMAIDAIPADLPGRDKIVADMLKTLGRGIKAELRSDKIKAARAAKKAKPIG